MCLNKAYDDDGQRKAVYLLKNKALFYLEKMQKLFY